MGLSFAILRNVLRHWKEDLLFAAVSLCVACFLCIYLGSIQKNQRQLDALAVSLPVTGKVTSGDGGQDLALDISPHRVRAILDSPYASDVVVTVPLSFNLGLEPPPGDLRVLESLDAAAANSLAAFPFLGPEDFTYLEGYDSALLQGSQAVCIAKGGFLAKHGLALGDTVDLSLLLLRYGDGGNVMAAVDHYASDSVRVVGVYSADQSYLLRGDTRPNLIFPYGYLAALPARTGLSAGSVSFRVDAGHLNEFKEEMAKAGFVSPNPRTPSGRLGKALSINDEHYVKTATQLGRSLSMLRAFLPPVFLATAAMGFAVSYLLTRGRRKEIAIMRTLGEGGRRIFVLLLLESGALTLAGGLLGMGVAAALGGGAASPLLLACFLLYWAGAAVALAGLQRFSVMEILSKVD